MLTTLSYFLVRRKDLDHLYKFFHNSKLLIFKISLDKESFSCIFSYVCMYFKNIVGFL